MSYTDQAADFDAPPAESKRGMPCSPYLEKRLRSVAEVLSEREAAWKDTPIAKAGDVKTDPGEPGMHSALRYSVGNDVRLPEPVLKPGLPSRPALPDQEPR